MNFLASLVTMPNLMIGWTVLALPVIALWEKSPWTMPVMVTLLLAAYVVGVVVETRRGNPL